MRRYLLAAAAACLSSGSAAAQTVAQRVAAVGDGRIELTFAARPDACGDGRRYIEDGFGGRSWSEGYGTDAGRRGDCERGPVRVLATVQGGEVTRLRTYVGPLAPASTGVPRLALSTVDAVAYLDGLAERGDGRAARDALLPIVLADSTTPWPFLVRLAEDESRSKEVQRDAAFWLSRGAEAKLGIGAAEDEDDDADAVRRQAVFALSQQPREVAVPRLLEIAKSASRPSVRRSAMFWLGQTGDRRGVEWFGEVLGVR